VALPALIEALGEESIKVLKKIIYALGEEGPLLIQQLRRPGTDHH
jgi:hypothetical protein